MLCSIFDASVIKTHISSDPFIDCIIMIDLYLNLEAEFKHFHRSVLHQCSLICTQMTDSFKLRCFWQDCCSSAAFHSRIFITRAVCVGICPLFLHISACWIDLCRLQSPCLTSRWGHAQSLLLILHLHPASVCFFVFYRAKRGWI